MSRMFYFLITLSSVFSSSLTLASTASNLRNDINQLIFNGQPDSQRFVSSVGSSNCALVIKNDGESQTSTLTLTDTKGTLSFEISDDTPNLQLAADHDILSDKVIHFYFGNSLTNSVKIVKNQGLNLSLSVQFSNGIEDKQCVVH
jgi:hypothetical protein